MTLVNLDHNHQTIGSFFAQRHARVVRMWRSVSKEHRGQHELVLELRKHFVIREDSITLEINFFKIYSKIT